MVKLEAIYTNIRDSITSIPSANDTNLLANYAYYQVSGHNAILTVFGTSYFLVIFSLQLYLAYKGPGPQMLFCVMSIVLNIIVIPGIFMNISIIYLTIKYK
jgi:hypothetical protein